MAAFFKKLSLDQVVELANASNYLDMPRLTDYCCAVIALNLRKCTSKAKGPKGAEFAVTKKED